MDVVWWARMATKRSILKNNIGIIGARDFSWRQLLSGQVAPIIPDNIFAWLEQKSPR